MALVEDDPNLNPSLMGIQKGFGNWSGGEGIGLNQDAAFGLVKLSDNGICASSVWGEVDFRVTGERFLLGKRNAMEEKNT